MSAAVAWPEGSARAAAFLNSLTEPLRATILEMLADGGIMLVAIGFLGLGVLFADVMATCARGSRQFRAGAERRGAASGGAARTGRLTAARQPSVAAAIPRRLPEQTLAESSGAATAGIQVHLSTAEPGDSGVSATPATISQESCSRSPNFSDERTAYGWRLLSSRPRNRRRRFGVDEAA
jgi:hypothetical protein